MQNNPVLLLHCTKRFIRQGFIGVERSSGVRLLPMCLSWENGRVCNARGRMFHNHDLPIASLWSAVKAVACSDRFLKYWNCFVFHHFFVTDF